jgi:hypothetical protein
MTDYFMSWEDLQGIPLEQQLDDMAAEWRHMSALLDQAVSAPEAFLELCKQAQQEATEALEAGDDRLISHWERAAEHNPTLHDLIRCFTGQRLQEDRR